MTAMLTLLAVDLNVAQNVAFGIIALVIIASALRVVTTNNVVHAALYLVMVLAGVGGLYFILGAEFVGTTQILVYIGAIIVLFLFGIMLTRAPIGGESDLDNDQRPIAAIVAVLLLGLMGYTLWDTWRGEQLGEIQVQTTQAVSDSIFSTYLVPFEAVSVLLLAALIGAIVLARRD